ncbi:TPA: hypothetical protein HA225_04915 [Candidatus Micrarchaeota archaeon]|nr:hypothetical protein [Candidatus Micrarchaeota archaeon]HIH31011.1 hypothetical protein [Candidatus Micrarchaeota archaeon]
MEGENRLYTVLAVAGGFFCLAASLFFQSAPAAALGAFFFFLTLALWKYGYALFPILMKNAKVVEAGRNFEIPPSQDVIVGRGNGIFLASVFLAARLYESSSENGGGHERMAGEMFEKAISSAGFPFKVCCLVCPLDLRNELEEMRTRRSVAESRRSTLRTASKKDPDAARLDREIAMWGRQIDSLTAGEKPLEVVFYLSTTGSGITKEEAIAHARAQSEELAVVVGSALACEVVQLKGEEMKKLFWWEFFSPSDSDELADQMF